MLKRLPYVMIFVVVLSLVLAACGDETATVPTYSGATSITIPDSVKSSFTSGMSGLKNTSVDAYKSTDSLDKIKSGFQSSFSSGGWSDQTSKFTGSTDLTPLTSQGAFLTGYEKGNKGAVVFGIPNNLASAMQFPGLQSNENVFMVISGNDA